MPLAPSAKPVNPKVPGSEDAQDAADVTTARGRARWSGLLQLSLLRRAVKES